MGKNLNISSCEPTPRIDKISSYNNNTVTFGSETRGNYYYQFIRNRNNNNETKSHKKIGNLMRHLDGEDKKEIVEDKSKLTLIKK